MKNSFIIPCSLSHRFITYGLFAIFSQLVFIALSVSLSLSEQSLSVVRYVHIPYLEYPLVSLALTIGGGLLIDYVILRDIL